MKKTNFFKKLCMLGLAAALVGTSVDASLLEVQAASKVTLSTKKKTIVTGQSFTLKVKGKGVKAKFKSSNPKVAKVAKSKAVSSVKITGKSAGSATITATSGKKKATCKVTVKQCASKVTLNAKKATLGYKKSMQLVATVTPAAASKAVKWSVDKKGKKVLSVNKKGKVTTKKKAGKAKVTATAKDGSKKKATVTITVKKKVTLAKSVTLNTTAARVNVGAKYSLKATIAPAKASNKNVYWTSSNAGVASVDQNGVVTAAKAGTATITATANDGSKKKTTATITVVAPSIAVTPATASVQEGASVQLTATVNDALGTTVVWTSSNNAVATVAAGKVTGVKAGTAVITATSMSGLKATATVTVTAKPGPGPDVPSDVPTTGITLDKTELKFTTTDSDQTKTLTATVAPANATDKTVTWTSSDETIATVADGVVTVAANTPAGKKTATITATTKGGQTATCTVQVIGKNNALDKDGEEVVFTLDKNADAASLTKGDKTIEKLQDYIEAKIEEAKSKDYILMGTDAQEALNKAWSKLVSRSSDGVELTVEDVDANTKNVTVSFNGSTKSATLVKGTDSVEITSGNRVVLVKDITVNKGTVTFKVDATVDGVATVTDKAFVATLTVDANDLYSASLKTADGSEIVSCVESEDDIVVKVNKEAANKVFEALGSNRTIDSVLSDVSAFNIYK